MSADAERHSPQSPYRSPTWGFSQAVHRSAVVIPSAFQVNRARDVALHPQADQLSGAVIPTNTAAIHRALHSLTHVPFLLRSPTNSGRSARFEDLFLLLLLADHRSPEEEQLMIMEVLIMAYGISGHRDEREWSAS